MAGEVEVVVRVRALGLGLVGVRVDRCQQLLYCVCRYAVGAAAQLPLLDVEAHFVGRRGPERERELVLADALDGEGAQHRAVDDHVAKVDVVARVRRREVIEARVHHDAVLVYVVGAHLEEHVVLRIVNVLERDLLAVVGVDATRNKVELDLLRRQRRNGQVVRAEAQHLGDVLHAHGREHLAHVLDLHRGALGRANVAVAEVHGVLGQPHDRRAHHCMCRDRARKLALAAAASAASARVGAAGAAAAAATASAIAVVTVAATVAATAIVTTTTGSIGIGAGAAVHDDLERSAREFRGLGRVGVRFGLGIVPHFHHSLLARRDRDLVNVHRSLHLVGANQRAGAGSSE